MQRANSLEKTLMLGKIEGRRRRGWQKMRRLDGISDLMNMSFSKLREMVKDREAWRAAVQGFANSWTLLSDWTTPVFITALFIIARTWKQPRCPLADEWIRKLWYIHSMEYYSAIKKNSFESVLMRWMKLEPIIQSEVSQKDKHQYSILKHIYGI